MDLYRYFHPHHNPRLRKKRLRLQEVGELEQAASELRHAIKRAVVRSAGQPEEPALEEALNAMNFVAETMRAELKNHPGDSSRTLKQLVKERENAPGWENWCLLIRQRLELLGQQQILSGGPNRRIKKAA